MLLLFECRTYSYGVFGSKWAVFGSKWAVVHRLAKSCVKHYSPAGQRPVPVMCSVYTCAIMIVTNLVDSSLCITTRGCCHPSLCSPCRCHVGQLHHVGCWWLNMLKLVWLQFSSSCCQYSCLVALWARRDYSFGSWCYFSNSETSILLSSSPELYTRWKGLVNGLMMKKRKVGNGVYYLEVTCSRKNGLRKGWANHIFPRKHLVKLMCNLFAPDQAQQENVLRQGSYLPITHETIAQLIYETYFIVFSGEKKSQ